MNDKEWFLLHAQQCRAFAGRCIDGVLLRNLSSWRHFTNPWQVMQAWNFNEPICFDLAANKKTGGL